jgi:NAD(P)-dependent dehydrogenase (short-subunit alcohol dehydrogenase family)
MALKQKTALVTGGSKGIGYAIADALLKEGVNVAITARTKTAAEKAAHSLGQSGTAKVLGFAADVRDAGAQNNVVNEIVRAWGGLDVLVANAGVGIFAPIDKMTLEEWSEVIDVNLTGVFNSVKASVEALKKSKGYIITISSLAGTNFFANGGAYNASKFGLTGFSQAIMLDLRPHGIKVSTIMPGSVATNFNGHQPNPSDDWKIQSEDVGQIVVDLLRMNPRTLPSKIEVRPSQPK